VRVEKWYLDCVTADGAGLIGYAARLGWGPLAVRCSETLRWNSVSGPAENRIVLGGAWPVESSKGVQWTNPALKLAGQWRGLQPAMSAVLLHEEAAGRIEWCCTCPAARVTIEVAGTRCEGLGYAEHLVMTLPPARLPLRELQWGRFIAEGQSCAWIRWSGREARTWCFHNGAPVATEFGAGPRGGLPVAEAVRLSAPGGDETLTRSATRLDRSGYSENGISVLNWAGHRLELAPGVTLRSGRVADTVFQGAPLLRRLCPGTLGEVMETKWCSRGVLTDAAGRRHEGWAIHEVAIFP
jgi:hypothetical protein